MPGDTNMPDHALRFCLLHRFDRAIARKNLLQLILPLNIVQLPCIEMIGLQVLQTLFEQPHRTIIGNVVRLRGEPNLTASTFHDPANIDLTLAFPVGSSCTYIINSQVDCPVNDFFRCIFCSRHFKRGLSSQAKYLLCNRSFQKTPSGIAP